MKAKAIKVPVLVRVVFWFITTALCLAFWTYVIDKVIR